MLHSVFFAALVDDYFVAYGLHRFGTCAFAYLVKNEFCRRLRILQDGDLYEFVRLKSVYYIIHLVVADTVFADVKNRI